MYQKKKRFFTITAICSILLSNISAYAAELDMNLYYDGKTHHYKAEEVNIVIDGEKMSETDMPPVILEDRTLVPARAVFETMGAEVVWNAQTKEVYVKKENDVVILKIDDEIGTKNGIAFTMDVPAKIINDRTVIPVRAVSEALGCEVGWDAKTRVVSIEQKQQEQEEMENTIENKPVDVNTNENIDISLDANTNTNIDFSTNTNTNIDTNTSITESTKVDINNNTNTNESTNTNNNANTNTNTNNNTNTNTNTNNNTNTNTNTNTNINTNTENNTGTIPTENSKVTGVVVPASSSAAQIFTITTSAQIAKYQNVYVDDTRIVLDIYYAEKNLKSDNMTVKTSPFVSAVRTAQHDVDGVAVTRVVLDLKAPVKYHLTQSQDKKSLIVSFQESVVQSLTKTSNGTTDTIQITGSAPLAANVSTLSSPNRVIIDIPYATSNLEPNPSVEGLSQIVAIRTSMYEEKTARVVLEIKDTAEYDVSQNGNNIIVTVKKSTLENLSYDASKKALVLKKVMPFDVNGVIHTDNYLKNQYKVALPSDFTSIYGYGTMKLPYEGVSSVTVANEGGRTTFSFSESNIRAFTVTEDSNNYYINIKNPKEVYSKVVLLDAGHGGNDPGTSGNGLNEKDITLSIVNKAYALLQNTDKVKVYLTRNDDSRPENRHRANTANDMADVLISIHMNSASPNPSPNGTEVLFITHDNDVQGKLTSQIVATTLLQRTVNALSTNNRGLKYDTQHQKNLILLNSTIVPSVIVETLFLSNPGDALKISNTANHDKMAQAIYDSIIELADKYTWR